MQWLQVRGCLWQAMSIVNVPSMFLFPFSIVLPHREMHVSCSQCDSSLMYVHVRSKHVLHRLVSVVQSYCLIHVLGCCLRTSITLLPSFTSFSERIRLLNTASKKTLPTIFMVKLPLIAVLVFLKVWQIW